MSLNPSPSGRFSCLRNQPSNNDQTPSAPASFQSAVMDTHAISVGGATPPHPPLRGRRAVALRAAALFGHRRKKIRRGAAGAAWKSARGTARGSAGVRTPATRPRWDARPGPGQTGDALIIRGSARRSARVPLASAPLARSQRPPTLPSWWLGWDVPRRLCTCRAPAAGPPGMPALYAPMHNTGIVYSMVDGTGRWEVGNLKARGSSLK